MKKRLTLLGRSQRSVVERDSKHQKDEGVFDTTLLST